MNSASRSWSDRGRTSTSSASPPSAPVTTTCRPVVRRPSEMAPRAGGWIEAAQRTLFIFKYRKCLEETLIKIIEYFRARLAENEPGAAEHREGDVLLAVDGAARIAGRDVAQVHRAVVVHCLHLPEATAQPRDTCPGPAPQLRRCMQAEETRLGRGAGGTWALRKRGRRWKRAQTGMPTARRAVAGGEGQLEGQARTSCWGMSQGFPAWASRVRCGMWPSTAGSNRKALSCRAHVHSVVRREKLAGSAATRFVLSCSSRSSPQPPSSSGRPVSWFQLTCSCFSRDSRPSDAGRAVSRFRPRSRLCSDAPSSPRPSGRESSWRGGGQTPMSWTAQRSQITRKDERVVKNARTRLSTRVNQRHSVVGSPPTLEQLYSAIPARLSSPSGWHPAPPHLIVSQIQQLQARQRLHLHAHKVTYSDPGTVSSGA
jgi:hypothetical protein